MAMDNTGNRRQAVVAAITAELKRQHKDGEADVNIEAMAEAIEQALDATPPISEGKRPGELNATNDD